MALRFDVHETHASACAYLAEFPLAFFDSLWMDTHLKKLREDPERVLAIFDNKVDASLRQHLARALRGGSCAVTGGAFNHVEPEEYVTRRRGVIARALTTEDRTVTVGSQLHPLDVDVRPRAR